VRLLLVLTGSLASLLVAELSLRLFGYQGDFERRNTVIDPRYGKLRKNAWNYGLEVPADGSTDVSIRDRPVEQPKPQDELRVLFVGDSGTEGSFVDLSRSFPVVFEAELASSQPQLGLRAINAGVLGMTNVDELHFLTILLPLEPDVVVLGLFMSNDINFNLRHTRARRALPARSDWLQKLRYSSAAVHFFFGKALALNSRYHWFRSERWDERCSVPLELRLLDANGMHMLDYAAGEVATYMRQPSALIENAWSVLADVLAQFKALGREHDFRFAVVLLPSPSRVAGELRLLHYPDIYARLARQGIELTPDDIDVDAPSERVLAICEDLGIVCIDPSAERRAAGMHVFFPDNEHLTELGHAVVASTLVGASAALLAPN
jgi:hypothetical protein